jgi:predicted Zn-dependent protease with MMP-like domain
LRVFPRRRGSARAHNGHMVEISDDDFERMVSEVFDALPDDMVRGLENVGIVIENQPVGQWPRLFGLYRGHPLTKRGVYGFGELPDRITLYKNNMQEYSADLDALRTRVRITLVHEIGHYFGLDDDRLGELGWA